MSVVAGRRPESSALRRVIAMLDLDRGRLAATILAGSAGLGSAVALAAVSAWLIARASQMPPVLDLSIAVVAVRAFGISRAVFRYVERLAAHSVALRGLTALRERLYTTLAAGRTDAVVALRRGDVLARTGADVDTVGDVVVRALVPAAVAAVVGAGTVVLVAVLLPAAALVLLLALLVAGVLSPVLTARAVRIAETAAIAERGSIAAVAMTGAESAAELSVSGRTQALLADLDSAERRVAAATDRAARPAAVAAGLNLAAMGLALLGALLLGIPATTAGTLAQVELAVVVLVPLAAFEATAMLPAAAAQLVRSSSAAQRIVDLLDDAAAGDPGGEGRNPRPTGGSAEAVGQEGTGADAALVPGSPGASGTPSLVARGLAGAWPHGPVVVEGVDLDVEPGRLVAVVGPSGVGKSTLLLTLAGLLPARAGTVRVSGRDPWLQDRAEVSRSLVLTAEDAHVFETTVLENLRVARGDLTEKEARAVLTTTGLGTWLDGLPSGLDTLLGADAATVSGGERRRLLVARALLSAAPILLLDEPAEHLDAAAADALVGDLLRVATTAGRGVVLVTHRLSALAAADEVILLGTRVPHEPARVVARGTHEQLAAHVPAYAWALERERDGTRLAVNTPVAAERAHAAGAAPHAEEVRP